MHWEDPMEEEMENPLLYSLQENPMDREALRVAVHSHKESDTTEQARTAL